MAKNHLREVGELLRRASISKDSNLCVKIARRGNAKGILAFYILIRLTYEHVAMMVYIDVYKHTFLLK